MRFPNEEWLTDESFENAIDELRQVQDMIAEMREEGKGIVGFLGSARVKPGDPLYEHAMRTAECLANMELDSISGGGTGIMEASALGTKAGGGRPYALKTDQIPGEEVKDTDIHDFSSDLSMFFGRRFGLLTPASALCFYEGGLGTINELSEQAMLTQMGIVDRVPSFLVQSRESHPIRIDGENCHYWDGLKELIRSVPGENGYIAEGDEDFLGKVVYIEDVTPEQLAQKIWKQIMDNLPKSDLT